MVHLGEACAEHLEAYHVHLAEKARAASYIALTLQQARDALKGAGVGRLADLTAERVRRALSAMRDGGWSRAAATGTGGFAPRFAAPAHDPNPSEAVKQRTEGQPISKGVAH